ncbi:MAG: hypothetical protein ACW99A_03180 [Candidatus Kariarchaeaceae archaeon]|jgi:hypothetical protein
MREASTSREKENRIPIGDRSIEHPPREPVLDEIYFYDGEDRKKNPLLEYSVAELTKNIWMNSYKIFESELQKIHKYIKTKSRTINVVLKPKTSYNENIQSLFDLEKLDKHQFLILKALNEAELGKISHEFRLRMDLKDLSTFVISRNLAYLGFMHLLKYTESIEEPFIYLLLILTFLIIYVLEDILVYFNDHADTMDYSIYEISRILSKERKMKFDSLVSDSNRIFDKPPADEAVEKLIILLNNSSKLAADDLEIEVDNIINQLISPMEQVAKSDNVSKRQKIQKSIYGMDKGKIRRDVSDPDIQVDILESVISSKPSVDRLRSEFKKSKLSDQMVNVLTTGNTCVLTWLDKNVSYRDKNFHIHYLNNENMIYRCDISSNVRIIKYITQMQRTVKNDMKLNVNTYSNSMSNILVHTGPTVTKHLLSPKIGIARPRVKAHVVIDSDINIFEKEVHLLDSHLIFPEEIIHVFQEDLVKNGNIDELELLIILEDMLQSEVFNSYRYEGFEDVMILFLSLDDDQQNRVLDGDHSKQIRGQLQKLARARNLTIVLLI